MYYLSICSSCLVILLKGRKVEGKGEGGQVWSWGFSPYFDGPLLSVLKGCVAVWQHFWNAVDVCFGFSVYTPHLRNWHLASKLFIICHQNDFGIPWLFVSLFLGFVLGLPCSSTIVNLDPLSPQLLRPCLPSLSPPAPSPTHPPTPHFPPPPSLFTPYHSNFIPPVSLSTM